MTDEQEGPLYLGMQVEQGESYAELHQSTYIKKILERFNLHNLTPVKTPFDPNVKLHNETVDKATAQFSHKYLRMFGSSKYLPTSSNST